MGELAETAVRGVIRCPGCSAPALWLSETGGSSGALVIRLSQPEASVLVREFSAMRTRHSATFSLVERITKAVGAQIVGVRMQPDGRGHIRAELELVRGGSALRVRAHVGDAATIAFRLNLPVRVPRTLLVHHDGLPLPSCPNEDGGLPPAPQEFVEFIDRITAEDFRNT